MYYSLVPNSLGSSSLRGRCAVFEEVLFDISWSTSSRSGNDKLFAARTDHPLRVYAKRRTRRVSSIPPRSQRMSARTSLVSKHLTCFDSRACGLHDSPQQLVHRAAHHLAVTTWAYTDLPRALPSRYPTSRAYKTSLATYLEFDNTYPHSEGSGNADSHGTWSFHIRHQSHPLRPEFPVF